MTKRNAVSSLRGGPPSKEMCQPAGAQAVETVGTRALGMGGAQSLAEAQTEIVGHGILVYGEEDRVAGA